MDLVGKWQSATQCYVLNIDRGTSLERPNHAIVKHSDLEVRQISI